MDDRRTQILQAVDRERLINTAVALVEIPSPTRSAAAVADRLAAILRDEGFEVARPVADWADSPAVVGRYAAGAVRRTLQFNGHLDTVHLPFVDARIENGILYGSGASDMKGGIAAMVEAMRALRDTNALTDGAVMLTAHDHHETPWGDGRQVNALIRDGFVGDGVLLPEYLGDCLPIAGRGLAVWGAEVTRAGAPVHEVLGGIESPSVIAAGADLIQRLMQLDRVLEGSTHPLAGRASLFIGQVHSGEIYNQSPAELRMEGTRRWLPGASLAEIEQQFRAILSDVEQSHNVSIQCRYQVARDAFELSCDDPLVAAVQAAHTSVTGERLPLGAKPFVDDGNAFVQLAGVPAITHGPNAKGAHTLHEEVPVDELVRVAQVYALTALEFCR